MEDDRLIQRPLLMLLGQRGWNVLIASTLAEGLDLLDQHRPHAVILDLMLPDGDGTELLRTVRNRRACTRVVVTTATSDPGRLEEVRALRPAALLIKPIRLADLLDALQPAHGTPDC